MCRVLMQSSENSDQTVSFLIARWQDHHAIASGVVLASVATPEEISWREVKGARFSILHVGGMYERY